MLSSDGYWFTRQTYKLKNCVRLQLAVSSYLRAENSVSTQFSFLFISDIISLGYDGAWLFKTFYVRNRLLKAFLDSTGNLWREANMRETFLSLVSSLLFSQWGFGLSILLHANLFRLFGPTTKTQFCLNLYIEEKKKIIHTYILKSSYNFIDKCKWISSYKVTNSSYFVVGIEHTLCTKLRIQLISADKGKL